MSIVYRPDRHSCVTPTVPNDARRRYARGTIFQCEACGRYWVFDGNARWTPPFPFGPTARRIKRIEAARIHPIRAKHQN